jgi:tetratricopeptide (TPR) repeat protein
VRKLGLLLLVVVVAACRAPAPPHEPPPSPEPPPAPTAVEEEAAWRAEMKKSLFERHLALAERYRDSLEPDLALDHVEQALLLEPRSETALALRAELQRMTGVRAGEATTLLENEWLAMQAREEEREVTMKRLLAEARTAEEAGDFERAKEAYERALFLSKQER